MKTILTVTRKFDSAHKLNNYDGPCGYLHGHTWRFDVSIEFKVFDKKIGFAMDFKQIKNLVDDTIVKRFDHQYLNDLPEFSINNPTAEHIGNYIFKELTKVFKPYGTVIEVKLWETENSYVTIRK